MTRGGQCSSQIPLRLKFRQAWGGGGGRGSSRQPLCLGESPAHPPSRAHQAVGVLGAGAARSALLVAAVRRLRALTARTPVADAVGHWGGGKGGAQWDGDPSPERIESGERGKELRSRWHPKGVWGRDSGHLCSRGLGTRGGVQHGDLGAQVEVPRAGMWVLRGVNGAGIWECSRVWGVPMRWGGGVQAAPYSQVWQSCGLSPQQCPSAHSARQSGPAGGWMASIGSWGGGTPQPTHLSPPPPTPPPQPSGCSQVRLRVLSTRVSLRSSLCRWKMSAQRMVSWKQSWGFPSMCTPPFRISARGEKSCHQHGGDGPMGTPGPTQRLGVPTQRLKGLQKMWGGDVRGV